MATDHVTEPVTEAQTKMGKAGRGTCSICWNDKGEDEFPFAPPTLACAHGSDTCRGCLAHAITADLASKGPSNIGCPVCSKPLGYDDVRRHCDEWTKERYEAALVRQALQEDESFVWCSSPGCDAGYVHLGGSDEPIVKCNVCGHKTCFTHRAPWHEGISCEEYDQVQEQLRQAAQNDAERMQKEAQDIKSSEHTIKKTTKPCPKCKRNIEKNGGCAHMQCSVCLYDFCWECMADYQRILQTDNSAHGEKCPFHPDNLED